MSNYLQGRKSGGFIIQWYDTYVATDSNTIYSVGIRGYKSSLPWAPERSRVDTLSELLMLDTKNYD